MRISDWSSDVCSSDLDAGADRRFGDRRHGLGRRYDDRVKDGSVRERIAHEDRVVAFRAGRYQRHGARSEEHTSELQSLMRISYAVFCLKKKKKQNGANSPDKRKPDKTHTTTII